MILVRYPPSITQCVRKVAVHLGYGNEDFVGSIEVAIKVILLYQTFMSGEQHSLQCIVIVHARLMS
jgi:hypothetical protein